MLSAKAAMKVLALLAGLGAAVSGWYAARLWHKASLIEFPQFDPPMASMDDVPQLHILSANNQLNKIVRALEDSSRLNASAARWTAFAAILAGLTAALGVI